MYEHHIFTILIHLLPVSTMLDFGIKLVPFQLLSMTKLFLFLIIVSNLLFIKMISLLIKNNFFLVVQAVTKLS